ncbi:MAG: RNA polymerase sigma factor [Pseudomonadota bacterium]
MGPEVSDEALVKLAVNGDGEAFGHLLERHYDLLFRVAYRFCGHREEAEDIAQEVCVSLPSKLKTFKGQSRFTTWLYQVVVNRVKDWKRKQSTASRLQNAYVEVEALRQEEAAETSRNLKWLEELMAQLPEDLKETAVLVLGEGMNHREASEVLGLKESTVSWRMGELKKALRIMAREEA